MQDERILGEDAQLLRVSGYRDLVEHSCAMARQCRRVLHIQSWRLCPQIYAQTCFVDAVRRFLIRQRHGRLYILLVDVDDVARQTHPLVDLAQQLTSKIFIRRRADTFSGDLRSFMLADSQGYVLRPFWEDVYDTRLCYRGGLQGQLLLEDFQKAWEQSAPATELRRLFI